MNADTRFVILPNITVGISLSRVHFILKRILKVRKISARWIPHILTDDQKRVRVQTAKQLLKMFPKFNQREFANTSKISYEIVRRWRKKFLTGTESIKDAAKSGRPVTVTGKANISKV